MAQQTLLEMTQEILESMESDIVDSITDTSESQAVARMIRRTYWDLFGILDLPENYSLFQLTETDATTPILMTLPSNCMDLKWIKYNRELSDDVTDRWELIDFIELDEYLRRSQGLNESAEGTETTTYQFDGTTDTKLFYLNTGSPRWFTSPDDYTLLFNSYDLEVETFLHADKTLAYGLLDPTFDYSDSYIPPLNSRQFSLLYNESKALCFAELKQTQNAKAEARSRRLLISSQHTKNRVDDRRPYDTMKGFGRR